MFVFVRKSENLQKYGYSGFCNNTRTFARWLELPYKKHLGQRGRFISMEPVAREFGYEFRAVVLETDEKYFFVAKPHDGNVLGAANGDIAFIKAIE